MCPTTPDLCDISKWVSGKACPVEKVGHFIHPTGMAGFRSLTATYVPLALLSWRASLLCVTPLGSYLNSQSRGR